MAWFSILQITWDFVFWTYNWSPLLGSHSYNPNFSCYLYGSVGLAVASATAVHPGFHSYFEFSVMGVSIRNISVAAWSSEVGSLSSVQCRVSLPSQRTMRLTRKERVHLCRGHTHFCTKYLPRRCRDWFLLVRRTTFPTLKPLCF